jgi:hypothetical protein
LLIVLIVLGFIAVRFVRSEARAEGWLSGRSHWDQPGPKLSPHPSPLPRERELVQWASAVTRARCLATGPPSPLARESELVQLASAVTRARSLATVPRVRAKLAVHPTKTPVYQQLFQSGRHPTFISRSSPSNAASPARQLELADGSLRGSPTRDDATARSSGTSASSVVPRAGSAPNGPGPPSRLGLLARMQLINGAAARSEPRPGAASTWGRQCGSLVTFLLTEVSAKSPGRGESM